MPFSINFYFTKQYGNSLWTEIPGKFTNDKYGFANVFKEAISINKKYSHISWFKVTIDNLDTAIGFSINNGDTKKVIVFIYDRIIVMQGTVSALFIYKINLTAMAHSENFN